MAVYTDVSFEDLEAFLGAYDLGEPLVFKGIAEGVSNSNYYLQTQKAAFILTLYERRVEAADLPFYLGLMEHLAREGVNCPTPLRAKDGAVTRILNGKAAAILSFLQGVSLRRPSPVHCRSLGETLAALHDAGAGFALKRSNALGLAGWKTLAADCRDKADSVQEGLSALIDEELLFLASAWPKNLARGIIHADLFPDNVLFIDDKISGIIDFYFACDDFLSYDLAVSLNAWCFENDGSYNLSKGRAMIAGYSIGRPLGEDEKAALPILCRGAALRFLLTRLYDWLNRDPSAFVSPKDPREFARRLRFHRAARTPEAYGL